MKTDDYVDHFTSLLSVAGVEFPDPSAHVKRAVQAGLEDFWGSSDWDFRTYEHTIALTTGAETYDLPDNFAGFRSFREEASTTGRQLQYFTYEDFHKVVPKLGFHSTGSPQAFTIFRDSSDSGKWKIKFFPNTDTITLYCSLIRKTGAKCDEVPDHLQACLEAFIAKHVYPYGSPGRAAAYDESRVELRRCQIIDNPDKSTVNTMATQSDNQLYSDRLWWAYPW